MKKLNNNFLKALMIFMMFSLVSTNTYSFFWNKSNLSKEERQEIKEAKKEEKKLVKADLKFRRKMKSYELEATINTSKGPIRVYLYPDAAPLNVANFVYLASRNYYDGLKFHRVVSNTLIQTGDPTGTGLGNTGYSVDDEIVDWLTFDNEGILGMANSGANTNSSQIFLTLSPLEQLTGDYTIIGEIISREDLSIARLIRPEDTIESIEIRGKNVNTFLDNFTDEVSQWESILNKE